MALKDIEKGSPIEPVFLKREERFMKSIPSDLRLSFEELNNYVASTRIPKGTILRRSLLRELPAVKSGDVVDAVYKSGNIEINFQAIALDGGTVGKLMRIKRDGKIMRGRVLSRGKVEIVP
ncbi:MAG: flagellar basal body P-ring formation chaperone FlgA [Aquificaceae bacterium]